MKPTPIHQWRLPGGVPDGFEVLIKRDDLTGAALTGNKVQTYIHHPRLLSTIVYLNIFNFLGPVLIPFEVNL